MVVSDYLREKCCVMNLESGERDGAIREIAVAMDAGGGVIDKERFVGDVLNREALGSTGIGNNVAIPHARTTAVKGFVIGFGRSISGIDFNAIDGEKVKLVFLMGAESGELNFYLRILAELSKLLMNPSFREALLVAVTPKEVIGTIRKFEKG